MPRTDLKHVDPWIGDTVQGPTGVGRVIGAEYDPTECPGEDRFYVLVQLANGSTARWREHDTAVIELTDASIPLEIRGARHEPLTLPGFDG